MKRSKFISSPTFPRSLTSLDEELLADSKLSEESKLSVHELVTSLDSHSWADLVKDANPTPPHFPGDLCNKLSLSTAKTVLYAKLRGFFCGGGG